MSVHHLKVVTTSQLGTAKVELDGEDMAGAFAALELRLRSGEPNLAVVELAIPMADAEGEFEVVLREETQALLKRLGWTPPD
jgi:hypothetical protein